VRVTITPVRRLAAEAIGLYWQSGIADDVPGLAWYLLASLVPLALGLTALAAVVLGDYAKAQALGERISQVLPRDVHDQVVQLILRTQHDSPLLIFGSIAGMVWTSSGAVGVLARCLSRLVGRPGSGMVIGKLRNLGVAAALTTLVVLMVIVGSAGTGVVRQLGLDPFLTRLTVPILTAGVAIAICSGIYRVLGGDHIGARSALAGGMVSGLILQATPTATAYYLRYTAGNTPVELFLMLSGVLITCYLAALGLLLGAGVTARHHLDRRLVDPDRPPGQQAVVDRTA
jgi:uncharacterized BrkB/YihY/UPF0761 family membrane protein